MRDAPTPMELVLVALGGCTGMDVISMLRKMRQDVTGYELDVEGVRSAAYPRVYTSVVIRHLVRGAGVSESNLRRAIGLSMSTYCPVFVDDAIGDVVAEGEVALSDNHATEDDARPEHV